MTDFWRQPIRGYPTPFDPWAFPGDSTFHPETAERVCAWWEKNLTLKDGKFEGKPFILLPWQRQMIGHLFGWKRPDGTRRFRRLFLYVPKKNGKTETGAGIGLILLCADGEAGAEVYSCASDTDQAKIVFDAAGKMVENNAGLSKKVHIYKGYKALEYAPRKSYWKVLSSRADSKHGPNVHGLLIDELHTQRDNELISTLEAGTISRAQPLVAIMTTAAHTGDSPCNRELERARGVRDGQIKDPAYMPVIFDGQADYEADPSCWKDPAFWEKVNPSFGVTVQPDYFAGEVLRCETEPSHAEVVKRLHLNIQTDAVSQWLDGEAWAECGATGIECDGVCYAALDLASRTDLTALAMYWPETHSLKVECFVPEETANKRAEYVLWAREGLLTITPGHTTDYRFIRERLRTLAADHELAACGYDPWNATHLVTELSEEDGLNMIEFRQGFITMNAPSKDFEALVVSRVLRHENSPVLNWMAGNAAIKTDPAGNIKVVKPTVNSGRKVDGIIAAIMATGMAASGIESESGGEPEIITI